MRVAGLGAGLEAVVGHLESLNPPGEEQKQSSL